MVEDAGSGIRDPEIKLPLIVVRDTRLALGRLGAYWRRKFTMPLVGLTGSSGKTTVKEMLALILREAAGAGSRIRIPNPAFWPRAAISITTSACR